ncbi:MAG TPA: FAD-dependent oxidoreductase [Gemmataceae bacterium]|nr:FAD-dependent oxidoreductase [Gemmataceae bacterium]
MTRHLIIGGGPAAINAIETIRDFDGGQSQITLVSDEPAYSRMVLPYWLADQIPEKQVYTADDVYYDALKVDRLIGPRVVRIDPQTKTAALADGQTLPFDNLLIATGSSAVVPPIPGTDLPGVYPLWTLAHTQAVLQAAQGKLRPEVVLVGAGFIGFIVLNAMYKRGWKLHVVEIAEHVLPRMLDADSARLVERWLRDKGVTLHLGTTVQSITEAAGRKRLSLANGTEIEADIVIVATGIRPNVDLVAGSGIQVDQGIVVNDRMQTNFPFIYAAGDVAQGPDLLGGPPAIHAIQPTAVDHGRVAGANMAGHEVRYPGSLLMNILDACGLQCASFGRWGEASAEAMTIINPDRPIYRKLLWTGDQITGAVFVGPANDLGMLNDVGMVKGIMQTRTALGAWKDFLRQNPFDVRRPFVAAKVGQRLAASTLLGRPAKARQYRFDNQQPAPQVTRPEAHNDYVGTKE